MTPGCTKEPACQSRRGGAQPGHQHRSFESRPNSHASTLPLLSDANDRRLFRVNFCWAYLTFVIDTDRKVLVISDAHADKATLRAIRSGCGGENIGARIHPAGRALS